MSNQVSNSVGDVTAVLRITLVGLTDRLITSYVSDVHLDTEPTKQALISNTTFTCRCGWYCDSG